MPLFFDDADTVNIVPLDDIIVIFTGQLVANATVRECSSSPRSADSRCWRGDNGDRRALVHPFGKQIANRQSGW